jgi:hypothetical protein
MNKFLNFLIKPALPKNPKDLLRIVSIDILTIGLGFTTIIAVLCDDFRKNQEAGTLGAALLILGVLIRLWRKDFK